MKPEETERDIRVVNNQVVDITDPQNLQVLGDFGTSLTGSANQTTDYKNYLNTDPTPTPEEFGIFLDRNQSQTDTTTNYKDYLKTVPVGEDPSPTGFSWNLITFDPSSSSAPNLAGGNVAVNVASFPCAL